MDDDDDDLDADFFSTIDKLVEEHNATKAQVRMRVWCACFPADHFTIGRPFPAARCRRSVPPRLRARLQPGRQQVPTRTPTLQAM